MHNGADHNAMRKRNCSIQEQLVAITVGVIGSRGIPNRYGGFERFVEQLVSHPLWHNGPIRFIVYGENDDSQFNGVTQTKCVGVKKTLHPFEYCRKSAQRASHECDIVLALGIGISFSSVLPRMNGRSLIVNPDGVEWRRTKWSVLGRLALRLLYYPALACADKIVIDAESLRLDLPALFRQKMVVISYPLSPIDAKKIQKPDIDVAHPFVLVIARLEPENNVGLIVSAFQKANLHGVDLIIVGATSTPYFKTKLYATVSKHVRYVGPIFDQNCLNWLRSACLCYVHGHSIGGTNPSLLEALAAMPHAILCHDNKYNREVAGARARYFGNIEQLTALLRLSITESGDAAPSAISFGDERYDPQYIAIKYKELFLDIISKRV